MLKMSQNQIIGFLFLNVASVSVFIVMQSLSITISSIYCGTSILHHLILETTNNKIRRQWTFLDLGEIANPERTRFETDDEEAALTNN